MNFLKYLWIKYKVKKDQNFLLEQGMKKAHELGMEINLGTEELLIPQGEKKGRVYLPPAEGGLNISPLLALAAEDFPEIAMRHLENSALLDEYKAKK